MVSPQHTNTAPTLAVSGASTNVANAAAENHSDFFPLQNTSPSTGLVNASAGCMRW